jgi:pimeloyl-ACP methyl ester carboxylesterase
MKIAKRLTLFAAIISTIGYVAGAVFFFSMQREFTFPRQHEKVAESPISRVPDAEAYRVATDSGAVDAWFLPPFRRADKLPVLIFSHGNGELIDQWVGEFDEFRGWGLGVLLVEYPGYGRSEGAPSEKAIQEALVKAYDLISNRQDVDKARMVGYGYSLGGGAICALARERHLAAMILKSTFTTLGIFAHRYFMPEFLIRDPFDNASVLRNFPGPVLVLHGRNDEVIPYHEGQKLAMIASRGTLRLYECGHQCWMPDKIPIAKDIHNFLSESGILQGTAD